MAARTDLLIAAQRAAEIFEASGAKQRVQEEGYTRVDPFMVAAHAGLPVMLRPMDILLGAFLRTEQPGIIVNSDRPIGLIHMTCAHELGHYFMGHETTTDEKIDYGTTAEDKEQEAEWFAYQLLMPRLLLAQIMRRKHWSAASMTRAETVYQLSLRLGMSFTATVWSLYRNKLFGIDMARQLAKVPPLSIKRVLMGRRSVAEDADVWQLDMADKDLVLEPRPSDTFVLDLPSHASAGYMWTLEEALCEGFQLQPILVDSRDEGPDGHGISVGRQQTHRYVLEPEASQSAIEDAHRMKVALVETQPWRGTAAQRARFTTSAQFEALEVGLTTRSKKQLMEEVAATQ